VCVCLPVCCSGRRSENAVGRARHATAADAADTSLAAGLAAASSARLVHKAAGSPDSGLLLALTSSSFSSSSSSAGGGAACVAAAMAKGHAASGDLHWRLKAVERRLGTVLRRERRQRTALGLTTASCVELEDQVDVCVCGLSMHMADTSSSLHEVLHATGFRSASLNSPFPAVASPSGLCFSFFRLGRNR